MRRRSPRHRSSCAELKPGGPAVDGWSGQGAPRHGVAPGGYAARPMPATTGSRQRVLMLAYYFPPLGGGGVQRTLKHVKYLQEEGFDAVVVTGRGRGYPIRDAT